MPSHLSFAAFFATIKQSIKVDADADDFITKLVGN
jgi:hypothetical protein